jgi:hypothetical protein
MALDSSDIALVTAALGDAVAAASETGRVAPALVTSGASVDDDGSYVLLLLLLFDLLLANVIHKQQQQQQ